MNNIELSGNLVEDVKSEKTKNDKKILRNKIAVVDSKGTDYEETYFIPITVYSMDVLKSMAGLKKGSLVKLRGKLEYKNYKKDGVWKNFTSVAVFEIEEIKFDSKGKCINPGGFKPQSLETKGFEAIEDDDLPF